MRILNSIAAAGVLALLTGCASAPKLAVLEPIGPAPGAPVAAGPGGRLQVYSARQREPLQLQAGEWWRWDTPYPPEELPRGLAHTGYMIRTASGSTLRYVRNAENSADPVATVVMLSPGRYQVEALATQPDGSTTQVLLPVLIEPGKITIAHLSGDWKPARNLTNADVVRLPDGQIAGWLAQR